MANVYTAAGWGGRPNCEICCNATQIPFELVHSELARPYSREVAAWVRAIPKSLHFAAFSPEGEIFGYLRVVTDRAAFVVERLRVRRSGARDPVWFAMRADLWRARIIGIMASLVQLTSSAAAPLNESELRRKQQVLLALLRDMGDVIVAYSGGTDSAYLAWAAVQALGENAVAITADSASIPASHKRDAEEFAANFGIRHEYIETFEFDNPEYVKNDKNRCFHCKDELFSRLDQVCAERGVRNVVYGVNVDDLGDWRPGQGAATAHNVKAPLVEAGLRKAEIRELSRLAGLPTWDRPAAACLSSRIPYGTEVTKERIKTVEDGEEAMKALGFRQFRTRFHGDLVRIEVAVEELPKALQPEMAARFVEIFKPLGFHYVTLDLQGYRQGSLNEAITH